MTPHALYARYRSYHLRIGARAQGRGGRATPMTHATCAGAYVFVLAPPPTIGALETFMYFCALQSPGAYAGCAGDLKARAHQSPAHTAHGANTHAAERTTESKANGERAQEAPFARTREGKHRRTLRARTRSRGRSDLSRPGPPAGARRAVYETTRKGKKKFIARARERRRV